ncbi:MAG TPA: fumarylacetoacetate hydrolase family protein, partial [Minicystis sp.]|nr:fumarylacetoacetate hydrolase family protein [Minicystis sp.]
MTVRKYARVPSTGGAAWVELHDGGARVLSRAPWDGDVTGCGEMAAPAELLAPVAPSKILCVGRNYKAHAKELGNDVPREPLLFWKPPSSIVAPGGKVELPPPDVSSRVDEEAELAVVIGRRARKVAAADAMAHVFGVTLAFDVTARDLQKKDGQWTRA